MQNPKQSKLATLCLTSLLVFSAFLQPLSASLIPSHINMIIYGVDDRLDVSQSPSPLLRYLADSTVLLVSEENIFFDEELQSHELLTEFFGKAQNLCTNEPFYFQPTAGFCSGTLVAPGLILTAGHCVNHLSCLTTKIVFGFHADAEGVANTLVPRENLFSCNYVTHFSLGNSRNPQPDFALIELDRDVSNHAPVRVNTQNNLVEDSIVAVIGHPSVLPTKIADNGIVRDSSHPDYFMASTDTYSGNSGSGVFNSVTGVLEGILVEGDTDFFFDRADRCYRSRVCNTDSCAGEKITKAYLVAPLIREYMERGTISTQAPAASSTNQPIAEAQNP